MSFTRKVEIVSAHLPRRAMPGKTASQRHIVDLSSDLGITISGLYNLIIHSGLSLILLKHFIMIKTANYFLFDANRSILKMRWRLLFYWLWRIPWSRPSIHPYCWN